MAKSYRTKYSKLAYRVRQQYKNLQERAPESAGLERVDIDDFRPLKELGNVDKRTIERLSKQAEKVLKSGIISLQKQRRVNANVIENLNNQGYNFINKSNIDLWYKFMGDLRAKSLGSSYYNSFNSVFNRYAKNHPNPEELKKALENFKASLGDTIGIPIERDSTIKQIRRRIRIKYVKQVSDEYFRKSKKKKRSK